uniref:Uncharacterized protein n=1 Tax=Setaria digitata TaxID=48799 RepID=A0A915PU74_9BILA
MPASEIIYQLKTGIIYANAEMAKSVGSMKSTGKDTMRSILGLIQTLTQLKKQCEGVTEVIKVLSDTLNERQNASEIRRTETDEHLPFTSIFVRKLRAEIEDNKNLAQEASAMTIIFNDLIKQSDNICKDARILMNSFLLEKKLAVEVKKEGDGEVDDDTISQKSNVNAFGDNMIDDDEYNITVREAKRDIVQQDDRTEGSGKTGIPDESDTIASVDIATMKMTNTD